MHADTKDEDAARGGAKSTVANDDGAAKDGTNNAAPRNTRTRTSLLTDG